MQIRPASSSDVPAVVSLVRTTLAEFGISFGAGAETDTQLEQLPESYTREGGVFFFAVAGAALLGTAGIVCVAPGVFELRKMYLAPEPRGRGVGQALLEVCLSAARERSGTQVVLDTTEQMLAAIRFYERNGFVRDDAQRRASRCTRGYRLDLNSLSPHENAQL